jgi:hypothetical protein
MDQALVIIGNLVLNQIEGIRNTETIGGNEAQNYGLYARTPLCKNNNLT